MCSYIIRNLMEDCFLDLLLGNPPNDKQGFYEWLDVLDYKIGVVLSNIGVINSEDELKQGESLV